MNTLDQVEEFHRAFNLPVDREPGVGALSEGELVELNLCAERLAAMGKYLHEMAGRHNSLALIRMQLLVEEVGEVAEAIAKKDLPNLLKELSDVQYVVDGAYLSFGLDHLKAVGFAEVHASNMSKLDENRLPIIDASGRVVKSDQYRKANMGQFFD